MIENVSANKLTYTIGNRICFNGEKFGWAEAVDILKRIYQVNVLDGNKDITLDLSNLRMLYPNGLVPIIAHVDKLKQKGVTFNIIPPVSRAIRGYAERLGWLHYLDPDKFSISDKDKYQNFSLHTFHNVDELNDCINGAIEVCLKQLVFANGVPQAFEWALNELAGNILVHSMAPNGWLQVLINKTRHQLIIILCDSGVGIPFNMKKAFSDIKTDKLGLEHAIKKGVTSNPQHGQGNGLAGSVAIAQASKSLLTISSGRGRIEVADGRIKSLNYFPPIYGTCVEMQFNTKAAIDLPKTLWGCEPTSYFETKYENETGDLAFRLRDHAVNFGNRPTGERIRNLVFNLLKNNQGHAILIEMDDVEIIASSFADELFGKLAVELGIIDFSRYIKLSHVNPMCKSIIDVAISQRIVQNYGADNITLVKDFA